MKITMKRVSAAMCTVLGVAACQGGGVLPSAAGGGASVIPSITQLVGATGTLESLLLSAASSLLGTQMQAQQDIDQALAQNRAVTLQPRPGAAVAITPVSAYQREGRACRLFALSAEAGGGVVRQRQVLACQVAPGQWQLARAA